MNIVVCVKQVPDTWSEKKLDPSDSTLDRAATDPVMNEMDEYAVEEALTIQEAKGGSLQDVANVIMANRIILSLFAPNFEGYDRLSQIDKSEWEVVEYEGLSPQEALQKFTSDPVSFRTTLKQLAASVSRSAETVAL